MTDTIASDAAATAPGESRTPILRARRLVKTFGRVVGLDGVSLAVSYTHLTLPTILRV